MRRSLTEKEFVEWMAYRTWWYANWDTKTRKGKKGQLISWGT
jgi:hypothetical protein